jgi:hypothetical protein
LYRLQGNRDGGKHSADAGKKRSHAESHLRPPPFEGNAIGESAFPAIPFIPAGLRQSGGERRGIALVEASDFGDDTAMNALRLACVIGAILVPAACAAGTNDWQRYVIAKTGGAIEIPMSIFSEDAGPPENGLGRRFYSADHRADLTVQAIPNPENDTPAAFLAKKRPPTDIVYKRVTSNFFVVSSFRNGKIWYNRCNRSEGYMNCVLINYPAAEKRQWDGVVTRISHTLTP